MSSEEQEGLREALKRTAVTLKEAGIPFALAGGYAVWARSGPEPEHDVDFVVTESDAAHAADALQAKGLRVEDPPEDWLFKVFTDGAMVDVLFRPNQRPVDRALLDRAEDVEVLSVLMPVLSATDLVAHKLGAMEEHLCDFAALLPVARALREQVDWSQVREYVSENDFALAFLYLLDRLGIVTASPTLEP
jgi:putative nucleotidyltransferase-like protein